MSERESLLSGAARRKEDAKPGRPRLAASEKQQALAKTARY